MTKYVNLLKQSEENNERQITNKIKEVTERRSVEFENWMNNLKESNQKMESLIEQQSKELSYQKEEKQNMQKNLNSKNEEFLEL